MLQIETIKNKKDILDNSELDFYNKVSNFPIYCGCTTQKKELDLFMDMNFGISKSTGIIQIIEYPTDEFIYINGPHNSAIGKTWDGLFHLLSEEMNFYSDETTNLYEIGAGSGQILKKFLKISNDKFNKYVCYEPNPLKSLENLIDSSAKTELYKKYWADETFSEPCVIIHSHLLEHLSDPLNFIKSISNSLSKSKKNIQIFAVPNLKIHFEKKYSNTICWEHKYYLNENYIENILQINNQEIVKKQYYLDHSIIYVTKSKNYYGKELSITNFYDTNIKLLESYFNYYLNYVKKLNEIILTDQNPIYIFGAHIWSQNLICFGLNTKKIINILDNDKEKQNKRLYGTDLIVVDPKVIENKDCTIILNNSAYYEEIKQQLFNLSNKIKIC